MRRFALPIATALIVAGCAAPPAKNPPAPAEVVQPVRLAIDEKSFATAKPHLGLWNGQDGWLEVGDSLAQAQMYFKLDGAKLLVDLPPMLAPDQFKSWGWEVEKSGQVSEAFACIYDDKERVVLAIKTETGVDQRAVDDLLKTYRNNWKESPTEVGEDPRIRYYFWSPTGVQRLMICVVTNEKGGFTVTSAVGVSTVMDAIKAGQIDAQDMIARGLAALDEPKKRSGAPKGANSAGP